MERFFTHLTTWFSFGFLFFSSLQALPPTPVTLQLLTGEQDGTFVQAGLLLSIPEGWHVYAPTPTGEEAAGFEPTLDHTGSSNIQDVKILWPTPHNTTVQDQKSYVYEGQTLIPLVLTPQNPNIPLTLNLNVSLLACGEMCVPVKETLSLTLKRGTTADPLFKRLHLDRGAPLPLLSILAIALLGGLILNFMPCVLPVLSLKMMSLVKHSKKTHTEQVKVGFLITGLGILASFLLLALLIIILKESGEAFGWGIHFQNPHFLLFVFLVLIAFTASLWGIFEIDLPSGLGTWLISHEGKGKIKDFLSGVFATLLATPCSAPFVGTALSFALSQNMSVIFLVFFFLGLGFASPYFLVASLPSRFIRLPKPGPWMVWIQKILGGLLALTALWIGWLLNFHLPLWALGLSSILAFTALSLFWIKHHKKPALKAWVFAAPLFLAAWAFSWSVPQKEADTQETMIELWKPFTPETIPNLLRQGKTVFVDTTAEWCVTCAMNKKFVLSDPTIMELLTNPNVIAMRADWTKQDPQITDFLQKYGRYGIPFNIVFTPQYPQGIALPEILTITAVKEAFGRK